MNTRKEVSRKSILSSHIHRVIEFRKNSLMTERDYKAASYLISNRRGLPWYEYMETGRGSVSSTMIVIDGEDLPEVRSGTKPTWL